MRSETNIYQVSLFTVISAPLGPCKPALAWHLLESRRGHHFGGTRRAAIQSGAVQVQGKYICTVFDLACIMHTEKTVFTSHTDTNNTKNTTASNAPESLLPSVSPVR